MDSLGERTEFSEEARKRGPKSQRTSPAERGQNNEVGPFPGPSQNVLESEQSCSGCDTLRTRCAIPFSQLHSESPPTSQPLGLCGTIIPYISTPFWTLQVELKCWWCFLLTTPQHLELYLWAVATPGSPESIFWMQGQAAEPGPTWERS
jgi:hypothetical protein